MEKSLKRVDAATAANWQGAREGDGRAVQNLSGAIEERAAKTSGASRQRPRASRFERVCRWSHQTGVLR